MNLLNVGKSTNYNVGKVIPMLLRVGGIFISADVDTNAGIAAFLDEGFTIPATSFDAASIDACFSATSASVTCYSYASAYTPKAQKFFYSPAMKRIVLKSTISAGAEFNHYALIDATENVQGMNLALVVQDSTTNNWNIVRSFRVFGFLFENIAALL